MHTHCLSILFHDGHAPVYSAHFEDVHPQKARLATAGGDNNVRLWRVERLADAAPRLTFLSTLSRHTQAVNVVRFSPRSEVLASAGDDGTVLLWVPDETKEHVPFGSVPEDGENESWRVQRTLRTLTNSEIYDLAWSPDGEFIITGSMDNIARIFHEDGTCVRQIAEHNHYVQGVAWDPLNEFVATQSSDRSVHVYHLRNREGQFSLSTHGRISRLDFSSRRSSGSPAPPDRSLKLAAAAAASVAASSTGSSTNVHEHAIASPVSSAPGTPTLPMNPPAITPSRRSSFGNSPSAHRNSSAHSSPVIPLPAVKTVSSSSPKPSQLFKSTHLYHSEAMSSFFRRLTFSPDGSLLITPAGQYCKEGSGGPGEKEDLMNTVYIYGRASLNKQPIAHLPGHKKPAVAIKCSPILYRLRNQSKFTTHLVIDTSSAEPALSSLPPSVSDCSATEVESLAPPAVFSLPYRMVYAIATQDSVLIYDTQQHAPLCIVSNLHYANFTDLTWSTDGNLLIMTSTDGFCSCVVFEQGELGEPYASTAHHSNIPKFHPVAPTSVAPPLSHNVSLNVRPPSPTRSNSSSSIQTLNSIAAGHTPTPVVTNMPGVTAATTGMGISHSTAPTPMHNMSTPPQTPIIAMSTPNETMSSSGDKREYEAQDEGGKKKRRIAPTLVQPQP